MRLNNPLDKILNSEVKVRALRIFCRTGGEFHGRQIAKMTSVTPKTAHEVLQSFLREGLLLMRAAGKTHFFRLNENLVIVNDVLRGLFVAEEALKEKLTKHIVGSIARSSLKNSVLSIAVFGSIHEKREQPGSDADLLVVVKTAQDKKRVEELIFQMDERVSAKWGIPVAPYINTVSEFRAKAKKKTGAVPNILKSYQLVYGARLEKLLR